MAFPDISAILFQGTGLLLFKIPVLILILLYTLFLFIVINRIKAFDRIVQIRASQASTTLKTLATIQFILAISLFFIALVIV